MAMGDHVAVIDGVGGEVVVGVGVGPGMLLHRHLAEALHHALDPADVVGVAVGGNDILDLEAQFGHPVKNTLFIAARIDNGRLGRCFTPEDIAAYPHHSYGHLFHKHIVLFVSVIIYFPF